jgi:hypothetical protein
MLLCLHCEHSPVPAGSPHPVLCPACARSRGVRRLYTRAATESPLWREHLARLRRCAEAQQPLDFSRSPKNVHRGHELQPEGAAA